MYEYSRGSRSFRLVSEVVLCVLAAAAVRAQGAEFRGMWVSRYDGWTSSDKTVVMQKIDEIMTRLGDNRFNAVMFQIRGQADTFYPSPYEPWSPRVGSGWTDFDPTAYAITAAHAHGLEFHAYINTHVCWAGESPPGDQSHLYYRHCDASSPATSDWLIHDYNGNPAQLVENYVWIAPGVPAAQAYLRQQIMYIVNHYNVDGVHFDRIRTPGYSYSADPISMSRYQREDHSPGEGNPDDLPYYDWTTDQITRFIRDTYAQVTEAKPQVKVSASPFGSGYLYVHQDPATWYSTGIVDSLSPMTYGYDFANDLPIWLGMTSGRHVYPGQSIDAVSIGEVIYDIGLVRSLGGKGTTIFSYSGFNNGDYWDEISGPGGPYASPATLPTMPWKTATGVIIGNIIGLDGQTPVVDAHITRNGSDYTALSSGDGLFSFVNVPSGSYTLTFSKTGCDTVPPIPCNVTAGQVTRLNNVVMGDGALVRVTATPNKIRQGQSVHFVPSVSLPTGGNIVSHTWHFGDGEASGIGMPGEVDRIYETHGAYLARLAVLTAGSDLVSSLEVPITVLPSFGDFDGDNDVDQVDFGHMQVCLSGTTVPQDASACQDAKNDGDSDVDQEDMGAFIRCLSGPGLPPDLDCAG
jgi:uncharacterized lipoprotein YddW (UPF0748 family)